MHNVATRKDDLSICIKNYWEKLGLALLKNGAIVIGVMFDYKFSFLKEDATIY